MPATRPALAFPALVCVGLALAGCSGDRLSGFELPGTTPAPAPAPPPPPVAAAPPVNMTGRWQLASPGRGQCGMVFSATGPDATAGTVAPEGGCPGKLFTTRKWTFEATGLVLRDHRNQTVAQLSQADGRFEGGAATGERLTLSR